jgi:hypothetical protein
LANLQAGLEQNCRQRSGRFLCLDADLPVETILFDTLRRRGWAR